MRDVSALHKELFPLPGTSQAQLTANAVRKPPAESFRSPALPEGSLGADVRLLPRLSAAGGAKTPSKLLPRRRFAPWESRQLLSLGNSTVSGVSQCAGTPRGLPGVTGTYPRLLPHADTLQNRSTSTLCSNVTITCVFLKMGKIAPHAYVPLTCLLTASNDHLHAKSQRGLYYVFQTK